MAKPLAVTLAFTEPLGVFYGAWSAAEVVVDMAVGKLLKLPPEETHLLTAAMDFSRKIILLKALVARQKPKHQGKIQSALNSILNDSKRNMFAHSYIASRLDAVSFVERTTHGKYLARRHEFTGPEFRKHVDDFVDAADNLQIALGFTKADFAVFSKAAFSANNSA